MMNLELLFEGCKYSGNKILYDMAVSHTNTTIKEHIRQDYTHFHVVSFNETTGHVIRKNTATGYADWSCWSQSEAWLIAGLTIDQWFPTFMPLRTVLFIKNVWRTTNNI